MAQSGHQPGTVGALEQERKSPCRSIPIFDRRGDVFVEDGGRNRGSGPQSAIRGRWQWVVASVSKTHLMVVLMPGDLSVDTLTKSPERDGFRNIQHDRT